MNKFCLTIMMVSIGLSAFAQQVSHYSLFDQNWYAHNPAYAGMDFELRATALYRSQWNGLQSAPESYHLNAHLPLYAAYGAAGLILQSEELGPRKLSYYALSYNYVMSTPWGIISLGARPGIYQWDWDGSQLTTPDGNYEGDLIDHMDPELVGSRVSGSIFNLDLGLHFQNDFIKAGLFGHQVIPSGFRIAGDQGYRLNFEYGAYGQYKYTYSSTIEFQPSILVITDSKQFQSAAKFGILIDKLYYGGVGLRGYSARSLDAFMLGGGLKMSDNFWIYYNFDIGLSKLRSVHNGSHEIVLTYRLNRQIGGIRPPKVIYNPRYLE